MSTDNVSLIVTAHPDDETIFFAGLILSRPKTRWHVICVTDGNADLEGSKRMDDCRKACDILGVENLITLGFSDIYDQRLDVNQLAEKLSSHQAAEVFTHGVLGEYGHPHHQDVSYATHKCFHKTAPVFSIAHNCFPEMQVSLSQEQWELKAKIYSDCYFSETNRFIQLLPIQFHEGFTRVAYPEVESIYRHIALDQPLQKENLKIYQHVWPYMSEIAKKTERIF